MVSPVLVSTVCSVTRRGRLALRTGALTLLALAVAAAVVAVWQPGGEELPAGLTEEVVATGLMAPTAARFAQDGRIFIAEKSGRVMVLDRFGSKPRVFADLSTQVYDTWDHGLLGLALHPDFPDKPYVYVSYTHNAPIGGKAPRWPSRDGVDICPDPPGIMEDGCISSGRLSVLTAQGDHAVGPERVLIEDWCAQSTTHSVGDIQFGMDGALYMSAGDGAFSAFTDYGQRGDPPNPCGDPPGGVGDTLEPPTAEGGALRAQDLVTPADPVTLDGTLIRVDPETGRGLPDNPLAGSADANARRVIAFGLKNPFRFTFRPGTDEVWLGDVGDEQWEEINRIASKDLPLEDFGWPCYEGDEVQDGYDADLQIATFDQCKRLYAKGPDAVTRPVFAYAHGRPTVPHDRCAIAGAAITGVAFLHDGPYPGELANSLYFSDSSRGCIWAFPLLANGLPDTTRPRTVVRRAGVPVDLQVGPDNHLYWVDIAAGRIVRLAVAKG